MGQLALDAVLSTYPFVRAGGISHRHILPTVSHANGVGKLALSCDVFVCHELKVVAIQQRAPLIPDHKERRRREFCEDLVGWAKSNKFSFITLVSSAHAHHREDRQLLRQPFFYFTSNDAKKGVDEELAKQLNQTAKELNFASADDAKDEVYAGIAEARASAALSRTHNPLAYHGVSEHDLADDDQDLTARAAPSTGSAAKEAKEEQQEQQVVPVPFRAGGITRTLYRLCAKPDSGLVLLGLVFYAAEGDNTAEGLMAASALHHFWRARGATETARALPAEARLRAPDSWEAVFRGPADPFC